MRTVFFLFVATSFSVVADELPCDCIHDEPIAKDVFSAPPKPSASPTDEAPIIDLIAFYNAAALQWAGNEEGVIDKIQESVDYANDAYENSGLPGRVRLLAIEPTTYTYPDNESFNRALDELEDPSDGPLDSLIERQRFYGADAVTLFITNDVSGGRANLLTLNSTPAPYSIIRIQNPVSTLAHELGHNMGLRHRAETYSGDVSRWFPDSFAEIFTTPGGTTYGTVMTNTSDFQAAGATRAPVFSSPSVRFENGTTGNDDADNVRAMRESMHYLAGLSARGILAQTEILLTPFDPLISIFGALPERSFRLQRSTNLKTWTTIPGTGRQH